MVNSAEKEVLQWHPGFVATFKMESQPDAEKMTIQSEYQLGSKPKEIDILAYAYFYVGDAQRVLENDPADITVTFVCNHYPRELLRHLWQRYGITAENAEAGVYYLDGSRLPVQIIINHELDPEKYLWLYSLRGNLSEEELLAVLRDYEDKKENKQYDAAMELITRANWNRLKEMRGMCQALDELMADKYREREEIGEKRGIALGIQSGMEQGIQRGEHLKLLSQIQKKLLKGKTLAEIADALEEEVTVIQGLVQELGAVAVK